MMALFAFFRFGQTAPELGMARRMLPLVLMGVNQNLWLHL
jgi:hypothetical protein